MSQLYAHVSISTADALAAGQTRAGRISVPLSTTLLEALTPEERADLARSCTESEDGKGLGYASWLDVDAVTPEGIAKALRVRIAKTQAENSVRAETARRIAALLAGPREERLVCDANQLAGERWSVRQEARELVGYATSELDKIREEAKRLNSEDEVSRDGQLLDEDVNLHIQQTDSGEWVVRDDVAAKRWTAGARTAQRYPRAFARAEELAEARRLERQTALKAEYESVLRQALSAEQWERYEAGVLPTKERDGAVRELLFAGVALPLYERLTADDLSHCQDTEVSATVDDRDFGDLDLSADAFAAAKKIRAAFAEHARLEAITWRVHRITCEDCDESAERTGARVTLRVNGHTYSREFAVD